MKQKIRAFLYRFLFLGKQMHQMRRDINILNCQLDFILLNSNRKIRRKWKRVLTNKRSPFYIGSGDIKRIYQDKKYQIAPNKAIPVPTTNHLKLLTTSK